MLKVLSIVLVAAFAMSAGGCDKIKEYTKGWSMPSLPSPSGDWIKPTPETDPSNDTG